MADLRINRKLNLAITLPGERPLHVFSTPVSRAVFEDHFLLMCRAHSALFSNGLTPMDGPKAAALMLKREAAAMGEATEAQLAVLMTEIHRLTNVLAPSVNGAGGYEPLPIVEAVRRKLIDEEDLADIEGAICFFTLVLRAGPSSQMDWALSGLTLFWNAQTKSSTLMDYIHSLRTPTPIESTGEKPVQTVTQALSIPS